MQKEQPTDSAVRDLLYQIRFGSSAQRNDAIESAALVGVKALPHLLALMAGGHDPGHYRASQEAVRRIALNAYRSEHEGIGTTAALVKVIGGDVPLAVKREALYLLGFASDPGAVEPVRALLDDSTLREDVKMALERMPFRQAESALRSAWRISDGEWKDALAYSLRKRRTSFRDVGARR